jgi:sarcosine oxidase subunit beta
VRRVDHLVVGAGIVGAAVAWELASRGREVLVLEREIVAAGASGGPGLRSVRANARHPRELALAAKAQARWPHLAEAIDHPTGFEPVGHLYLTERDEDRDTFARTADIQTRAGIRTEVVEGRAVRALEPGLTWGVVAVLHCPADGVADHTLTTQGFATAARAAGAEVLEHTEVTALRSRPRGLSVVTASGESIEADHVVLAANAGMVDLVATLGVRLPLHTVFPQVLVLTKRRARRIRHVVHHSHRALILKALDGAAVMVTGGRLGRPDDATGRGVVIPQERERSLADAAAVYPELEDATVDLVVADRAETVTQDFLPVIDRLPGTEQVWLAAGWSGHGFAIAPAAAQSLAEWIVREERPPVLSDFRLDRLM